jgi:hypothetical protein
MGMESGERAMAEQAWEISGQYMESCNCAFVCPCLTSNMVARPDDGVCRVAMAFQIEQGHMGDIPLDGLGLIVLAMAPGPMIEGDWTVGLIVDERATEAQREALGAIMSGGAGGPMEPLAALVGTFAGVEARPITFERDGMTIGVTAPDLIDHAVEGVASIADPSQALHLDNVAHPANSRLALAKARHSHFHAFGIDWDDASGMKNGHFAPFHWRA